MSKNKANSKLQNVKAVKQMLEGTHKFQTKKVFGYNKAAVKRKVGERWTDENGYTWEQKDGFKIKHGKLDELRTYLQKFPSCPKENCTCGTPSQADLKMKAFHGMCLDCVIDKEHKIRLEGDKAWREYERGKMKDNARSWLKESKKQVGDVISIMEKTEFVNADGSMEKWESDFDPKKFKKNVEKDFKKFEKELLKNFEDGESNE